MIQLSSLLLFVALSYGQQNTTQIGNVKQNSVLIDMISSAKQSDEAHKTSKEMTTSTPNIELENEAKQIFTSYKEFTEQPSCTNLRDEKGTCVPYYRCNDSSLYDGDYGYGLIELHGGFDFKCYSYMDICCPPAKIVQFSPTVVPGHISNQVNKTCGHRNPDGVGFNIAGDSDLTLSRFGEFPWMVAVFRVKPANKEESDKQNLNVYLGGGSLIHPRVVLTAAHVVHKDTDLRVRAGEWDTQIKKEMYPHQDRNVKEVVLHPDFNTKNFHSDIALLFLSEPVDITLPHVGVACLPSPPDVEVTVSRTQCLASGWGKNKFEKQGRYSVILKKMEYTVVNHTACEKRLRKTCLSSRFDLDLSFMCVTTPGGVARDTRIGDGGGPLLCPVQNKIGRYVQNGILSWRLACGGEGLPDVYVNVTNFRRWIDENVVGHGYDPNVYTV